MHGSIGNGRHLNSLVFAGDGFKLGLTKCCRQNNVLLFVFGIEPQPKKKPVKQPHSQKKI